MESTHWDTNLRIKHTNSNCQLNVPYYVCTITKFSCSSFHTLREECITSYV